MRCSVTPHVCTALLRFVKHWVQYMRASKGLHFKQLRGFLYKIEIWQKNLHSSCKMKIMKGKQNAKRHHESSCIEGLMKPPHTKSQRGGDEKGALGTSGGIPWLWCFSILLGGSAVSTNLGVCATASPSHPPWKSPLPGRCLAELWLLHPLQMHPSKNRGDEPSE